MATIKAKPPHNSKPPGNASLGPYQTSLERHGTFFLRRCENYPLMRLRFLR